ncbi:hypothetical protein V8G54_031435 [Vigna mungo]|uniref:Uncharacterized protein n=1 Tax=Vigna mungo TaxID=3915 RepID=A0AAQ3MJN6_VIGMU
METRLGGPVENWAWGPGELGLWANMEIGLGGPGQCKNWAYGPGELGLWANMEIGHGLRASVKTRLVGQYGNWAWWASVEIGLKGQCKNWAYGPGELGLWANMEIGLGGPVWKLGLRVSVKTGLMGQTKHNIPKFLPRSSFWENELGFGSMKIRVKISNEICKAAPVLRLWVDEF